MAKITTETYTLPVYWASALINADESGMEDNEIAEMDAWLDFAKPGYCVDVSEESWFSPSNDAGTLAGDVAEFTFIER